MKRLGMIVMAGLLLLGLAQCKKEQTPAGTGTEGVRITLNVGPSAGSGTNGSRVVVDPTGNGGEFNYATVNYENGDIIYVGYNGACVGSLTCQDNTFSGEVNITETVEGEHLHFYLLGGKGFTPQFDGNTATVNISEQATNYPVISYAPSKEAYNGAGSYTAKLMNKCSIVKFNVTTTSTAAICITGMKNKVTINFADPTAEDDGFSYDMDDNGLITMPAKDENNVTWAIVLPQEALAAGEEGSAYTEGYTGTRPAMEAIEMNKFLADGIALTVNTPAAPAVRLLSEATAADCGMVVCADGHLHPAKTAVPSGCTAVGILGKVTETGHGLILALWDAECQYWYTINGWNSETTYAGTTLKVLPDDDARGHLTSYTTLGETIVSNWAVAQKSDYDAIFTNLGSKTGDDDGMTYDTYVDAYITTGVSGRGFTDLNLTYWSATAAPEYVEYGDRAWLITSIYWAPEEKTWNGNVRPVLGF